jgi:peptidoglycan hydrolase-like protein with peptidoglycan-binding domain
MPNVIQKSVGEGGINRPQDVGVVQTLLNLTSERKGTPKERLAVDGIVGPKTIAAIREYQAKFCKVADGLIDPGKETISRLNQTTPVYPSNNGVSYLRRDRNGRRLA